MVSKSFQWLLGPRWQLPLLVLPPAWFPSVVGYCQEHCVDQDSKADFKDGKTECWDWLLMSAMDMVWGNDDQRATIYLSLLGVISEKALATHSSTLAWKVPWTEETGGLQFMGSLRVGHDWATLLSLFTFMHWRRKWQPTPVFLPGESQGERSLVDCHLWGRTESDTTEVI